MSLYFVCVCVWKQSYLCTGFPWSLFFYNSGRNIERSGKRGELLIGRMQNFFLCEKMSKQGEWKWKVDDVGVIGAMGDVLGSLKQVKGEREKQTYLQSLTIPWW